MSKEYKKVCKIEDERLKGYVNRLRSGVTQVFYTGNDERDFKRYRAEGGGTKANVVLHDKPDTIRLEPPEKHYFAELIDDEWWWVNGCAECIGNERSWHTYIECDEHNVCRTCKTARSELTEAPWGGQNGWQCKPCDKAESEALKRKRLEAVAAEEYDEWDFHHTDQIVCPHCASSYEPEVGEVSGGEETCGVCGGVFEIEVEYTVTYSTTVVGDRVTLDSCGA